MTPDLLLILSILVVLFITTVMLMLRGMTRQQRIAQRLRSIKPGAERALTLSPASAALGRVEGLGASVVRGRLLSPSTLEGLEQTLRAAGFRGERALGLFVGAKIMLLLATPLAFALGCYLLELDETGMLIGAMVGGAIGLLAPDFIASRLRARYLARLERGLPDGLDLLVICAEAGLALQPAMQRVVDEIAGVFPQVAAEFRLTLHELRVLTDRREALTRMGKRTRVIALQRLAQTLIQSIQYGTPMSQALRMLAAELRQEQLLRFEARAARLPVLLTLPMVAFILPTLFLVVGGPAAVQVMRLW
ncbi:type II secretion system F family protein [Plastoroseomonas hellenica]|uniref:type II secretion system F family protein n=1 Tax=Plastoroseomonas hellenica TaxID=2687306 RepID=UPI001BA725FC|nr:type II secretion system F family protein [Plastoroseomonas hellenica]MBR0642115.1 type II secretion system F family protein [Plastoroseomonas hellenica]